MYLCLLYCPWPAWLLGGMYGPDAYDRIDGRRIGLTC